MENTLRLSIRTDPVTLDPQKSGDPISSALIFLLFKGLTRLEADNTIRCDLARSFHSLNNDKKYVFELGEYFWSDGSPITAHDFVRSWKRALDPAFQARSANFFYYIKNAEKAKKNQISIDKVGVYAETDLRLVVELEHPCPFFPELTSFCPFFPISPKVHEDEISAICSGTFQLEKWDAGKELILKRNPLCKDTARPEGMHIRVVSDEKEAFALFENDELDWIGDPISPLPVNYLPALLLKREIKPIAGIVSCWFNTLDTPFSNVHLRKAFAYAIPRDELVKKLLLPDALIAHRLCPSLEAEEGPSPIRYDQEIAREHFRAAQKGKPFKSPIVLSFEATDTFSRIAAMLKTYWEKTFEIQVQLDPLPFKELFQRLPRHQFHVSLIRVLSQYTDIMNFLERFESSSLPRNFSGWENRNYQALLKRYHTTADHQKRQMLAKQAEDLLLEEMPIAPVYYSHYAYLQKPHVHYITISPTGVVQFDRAVIDKRQIRFDEEAANVGT